MEALRFEPLYRERPWGGRMIEASLGRTLPRGSKIGESWEIVDRPDAQSVVRNGRQAGRRLRDLIQCHASEIMGPRWPGEKAFPILVKWLDCRERLSVQVHPSAAAVAALGGEPKTENWYVAEAAQGAKLLVGLRPGVGRVQFERALAEGTVEACLNPLSVTAGDSLLVRGGTVHAIDAGSLILEIQQNSDTTYRVYDWGRMEPDGRPRQLHVRESLASILWDQPRPRLQRATDAPAVLADCSEFRIRSVPMPRGATLVFPAGEQPRLLHVVQGGIRAGNGSPLLVRGENILLPCAGEHAFSATENSLLLVTENFA